jgi:tetratricopeptide (TPR) repeat protein
LIPTTSSNNTRFLTLGAGALGVLYVVSAYPTLSPYRDSGDMAAAAWTLGVSHPPGYPLYVLLAHLWAKLMPLGNVAYRLHALSAVAGAGACWLLALAVRKDKEDWQAPLLAAVLLGLAPAMWHLSLVSEMYSLNAFVGALLLWLMLPNTAPDAIARRRRLYAGALLFGLGLGNHQTLVAALPGLLWIAHAEFYPDAPRFWRQRLPVLSFFALLGVLLYAYLPLRSLAQPVIDWGEPESLRNFFRMMTRADYGGVRLHPERPPGIYPSQWFAAGSYALGLFTRELSWVGSLLACWGLWCGRARSEVRGAFAAFFLSGPAFVVWANLDPNKAETYAILEPHLVLPLVFAAALTGWGAREIFTSGARLAERRGWPPGLVAGLLFLVVAGGWAAQQAQQVAPLRPSARLAYRSDFSAYDFGSNLLAALPQEALLVDPDDPTAFTLSYFQAVQKKRTDVVPILYFRTRWGYQQMRRRHPELLPDWEMKSGQQLLGTVVARAFSNQRALFIDLPPKAPPGTVALPASLVYRLHPMAPKREVRENLFARGVAHSQLLRMRPSAGGDFFTEHTHSYWTAALNNAGIEAQTLGHVDAAIHLYRRALHVDPNMPEAWNNLANAWLRRGDGVAAEGSYKRSIALKPSGQVIYNLGRVYLLGGRLKEAEAAFRRAMRLGGPLEARNDLGLVFLRGGRVQAAAEHYTAFIREYPRYSLAYYNLALAYEQLGDKDKAFAAVRMYGQLASSQAEKAEAQRWLDRLNN